jgi:hypothetical protein
MEDRSVLQDGSHHVLGHLALDADLLIQTIIRYEAHYVAILTKTYSMVSIAALNVRVGAAGLNSTGRKIEAEVASRHLYVRELLEGRVGEGHSGEEGRDDECGVHVGC